MISYMPMTPPVTKNSSTPLSTDDAKNVSSNSTPALYDHQITTVELLNNQPYVCDFSDPGTGKTRSALEAFATRRANGAGPALIIAPKSILAPAWAADIKRFFPRLTYSIAYAHNRAKAFDLEVDVYITNHDAVSWIQKNWNTLRHLHVPNKTLVVDESTAFKNPNAQRSKACKQLATRFDYREILSGTPNPNSILELWHQAYICDGGQRLGSSYWKFRSIACEPVQVGPGAEMVEWRDKPGVEAAVFDLLSDITVRHRFEDCISIPPNVQRTVSFDLTPKCQKAYDQMEDEFIVEVEDGDNITAVHAAAKATKLLQIASGAVYNGDQYALIDPLRYELVIDLVEQRTHSVVAFLWRHQRDQLVAEARKRGIIYGVIDGSVTNPKDRTAIVEQFQAGELQVIFAHPQSAGHGLTLTKGIATIWASPTYNAEHYEQFNRRIYRSGQTQATETIHVIANNTIDERVRTRLGQKLTGMQLLLDLMETK